MMITIREKIGETIFKMAGSTDKHATLQLKQKVRQGKLTALFKQLNVTNSLDLINLDQFKLIKDPKKRVTVFNFYKGDKLVSLSKRKNIKELIWHGKCNEIFFIH